MERKEALRKQLQMLMYQLATFQAKQTGVHCARKSSMECPKFCCSTFKNCGIRRLPKNSLSRKYNRTQLRQNLFKFKQSIDEHNKAHNKIALVLDKYLLFQKGLADFQYIILKRVLTVRDFSCVCKIKNYASLGALKYQVSNTRFHTFENSH